MRIDGQINCTIRQCPQLIADLRFQPILPDGVAGAQMLPRPAAVGVAGQVKMPAYLVGKQFAAAIGTVNQPGQPVGLRVGRGVTAGFQQLLRLQKSALVTSPSWVPSTTIQSVLSRNRALCTL